MGLLKTVFLLIDKNKQEPLLESPAYRFFERELKAAGISRQLLFDPEKLEAERSSSLIITTECDWMDRLDTAAYCCLGLADPGFSADSLVNDDPFILDVSVQGDMPLPSFPGAAALLLSLQDVSASYLEMQLCHFLGEPFVVAETGHLILRESTPADFNDLLPLILELPDPPFPVVEPDPRLKEAYLAYIEHAYQFFGYGVWTIVERSSRQVIGWCGLYNDPELHLGYVIHPDFRRRGYALEACQAILRYAAQDLDTEIVFARIRRENTASIHLAQQLGLDILLV
ncbi:MAG: GNAT family N-acetyltransferase [Lachnospiraceae bacterium]|nr:GNAT family N-acetyltransferase [Lachnospiraceae bacterium]